ncbi:MAG: 23S rRNA methyltransferase, partial [Saccharopolyspora rectivirgula]
DTSKYACRRAAKAHPRIGAVVADAWQRMPLRTGSAAALLNVFAPRNAAEMHRVLRPGGRLVVVTPNQQHLASLVDALGLLHVDERKRQRLDAQLAGRFEPLAERTVEFPLSLTADDAAALVAMGPSAWHTSAADLRDRIAALPSPLQVTASVSVGLYQRC